MTIKNFKGYLALNYETGEVNYTKRKPVAKQYGYWISLKLDIDIDLELPEPAEYKISGQIRIPEAKAKEIMVENL